MDGSSFLAAFASSESAKESGSNESSQNTKIQFNGIIDSFPVKGENVTILPSPGDHDVGSSKLKITNIVNFGWEFKYYPGQLVTVHKNGDYFAYGIYSVGQRAGIVRVVHRKSGERVLLKGMRGSVQDLSFAHCLEQIILGVVDEWGNLFVYKIEEKGSELKTTLLLDITSSDYIARTTSESEEIRRVIWCPYLPEDDETIDDASSRLLVLINGSEAQMWNVDMVINEYGSGQHQATDVSIGKLVISDHTDAITDATFSPDGTALATASLDGQVKFFQVYMHGSESPRCLHEWSPHEGKPVSSLFFLDNHKNYNPDVQFWKFVVTGAEKNSEIKIWSCETWECLQTVSFRPVLKNELFSQGDPPVPAFKISLDLTSQFLLLSDINRKNVYVLQLQAEGEDKPVTIVSVSEFATPSPFLSMSILEAGIRKRADDPHTLSDVESDDDDNDGNDNDDEKEDESDEELLDGSVHDVRRSRRGRSQGEKREATAIKFLLVQPKSLQECRILYDDAFSSSRASVPASDAGSSISIKTEPKTVDEESILQRSAVSLTPELSSIKSPNIAIVKKEVVTPNSSIASSSDIPPLSKIKKEPVSPMMTTNVTDDLKIKTSSSAANTPNRGTDITNIGMGATPSTDRLQEAADKITLMSPDAFSSPLSSQQTIKIKKETITPSNQASNLSNTNVVTSNASSNLAGALNIMSLASAGSSPSREVQDILAESEEQGGITADIVITEEPETDEVDEDDDEEEYKSPLDGDDDEDPLYDEEEEFKGKLEEYNPENMIAKHSQSASGNAQASTELAGLLDMIKKEKKPDQTGDISIKTEHGVHKFEDATVSSNNTSGGNSSAWLSIVPKQELMEPKPTKPVSSVGVDPLVSPLAALMSGNANVNRSFELQNESMSGAIGGGASNAAPPILFPLEQLQSTQHELFLNIQQQMENMTKTMSNMASLIQTQRAEIQILREEVRTLTTEDRTRLEDLVKDACKGNASQLEEASKRDNKALLSNLTQTMNTTVSAKLDATVKREIKKLGGDLAKQTSQTIEKQLTQDSQIRAAKCDQAMKEAISKVPYSKPAMEQLGQALAQSLTPVLQSSFREVFTTVVIPGFERATHNLYANLASTFTKGTKEYENAMKNQLNKQASSFLDPVARETRDAARELQTTSTHSAKTIEAAIKEFQMETRNLITTQQRILSATPTGLQHLGGNVTPNSGTPKTGRTVSQQDIRMMLGRGQFNEAFQAALSAENLSLVVQTCEMVNPKQMFAQAPCPLAQSVLLSLIQHLGNHLHDKTELKHTYLEEAIMNLDPDNAATKAHIGLVTKQLSKQLQEYIGKNPHEKITRSMKMLLMATESLRKNTD